MSLLRIRRHFYLLFCNIQNGNLYWTEIYNKGIRSFTSANLLSGTPLMEFPPPGEPVSRIDACVTAPKERLVVWYARRRVKVMCVTHFGSSNVKESLAVSPHLCLESSCNQLHNNVSQTMRRCNFPWRDGTPHCAFF